jgi:hypothetical protein
MKWVTWENVGVDRMACAWLIRRQIDKKPTFLFIPKGSTDVPKGAEPFDIPGVRRSHHQGHCSPEQTTILLSRSRSPSWSRACVLSCGASSPPNTAPHLGRVSGRVLDAFHSSNAIQYALDALDAFFGNLSEQRNGPRMHVPA